MAVSANHETPPANSKSNTSEGKSSKYSIPKVQKEIKGYLREVAKGSRDEAEVLSAIKNSFLNQSFNLNWNLKSTELISNPYLEERFQEKRRCLKNLYNCKEIEELFCFQTVTKENLNQISTYGARVNNCVRTTDSLGNPTKGVHFFKHADICIQYASVKNMKLLIYKVITGKVKVIDTQEQGVDLEPTPSYDCHISRQKADPSCSLKYNIDKSKIYLYEYDDMCDTVEYPRQCLPYAVVTFILKSWFKNIGKKSKRNRNRISDDEPAEKVVHRSNDFLNKKTFDSHYGYVEMPSKMVPQFVAPNNTDLTKLPFNSNITLEDLSRSIFQVNALMKLMNQSHLEESSAPRTPSPPLMNSPQFSPLGIRISENPSNTIKLKQCSPLRITIRNTNSCDQSPYYESSSNLDNQCSADRLYSNQKEYFNSSEIDWREQMTCNEQFYSDSIHTEQKNMFNWSKRNLSINNSYTHNQFGDIDYRGKDSLDVSDYRNTEFDYSTLESNHADYNDRFQNANVSSNEFATDNTLPVLTEMSESKRIIISCINALVINVLNKKLDDLSDVDDKSAVLRTIEIIEKSFNLESEGIHFESENRDNNGKGNPSKQEGNSSQKISSIYSPDGVLSGGPLYPNNVLSKQYSLENETNRKESLVLDDLSNQSDAVFNDDNQIIETYDSVPLVKTDSDKQCESVKIKKSRKPKESFHGRTLLKGEGVDPRMIPIKISPQSIDDPRIKKGNSSENISISLIIPEFHFENGCEVDEGGKLPNFKVSVINNPNPEDECLSKKSREDMRLATDEILNYNLIKTNKNSDVRNVINVIKKSKKQNKVSGQVSSTTKKIDLQNSEIIKKKMKVVNEKLHLSSNGNEPKIKNSHEENTKMSIVCNANRTKEKSVKINFNNKQNNYPNLNKNSAVNIDENIDLFLKQIRAATVTNKKEKSSEQELFKKKRQNNTSTSVEHNITELEPNNLLQCMSGCIEEKSIAKIRKNINNPYSSSFNMYPYLEQKTDNQKLISSPISVSFNGINVADQEVEGFKDKLCYDDMELGSDSEIENEQFDLHNSSLSRLQ